MTGAEHRTMAEEQSVHRHLMRFGEAKSLAAPPWEERDTSVRAIAAHLARLWESPATDAAEERHVTEKGLPHARASVLNLIVTVVDDAAAERVVRTMLDLGVRHPSRAIVLVPRHEDDRTGIDARISTHCNDLPLWGDRICYEEIVLTVRGEAAAHLAGVVAPLLIHDLPTHVWWPGQPPVGDPVFDQLVELADRVIIDSSDLGNLLADLRRVSTLRHRGGVGDLSWERLAWWQELTAQFFDAPRFRRYLPNLNRLVVRYAAPASAGSEEPPLAQALLYAGWIATRLGWRRQQCLEPLDGGRARLRLEGRYEMVDLLFEPDAGAAAGPGDLTSVRLRALGEAGAAEFIIDREPSGAEATVATNADGMTALLRRMAMEPPTQAELLSGQLARDQLDPIYTDALRAAAILLGSATASAA